MMMMMMMEGGHLLLIASGGLDGPQTELPDGPYNYLGLQPVKNAVSGNVCL
jgi:hypothetical protein